MPNLPASSYRYKTYIAVFHWMGIGLGMKSLDGCEMDMGMDMDMETDIY